MEIDKEDRVKIVRYWKKCMAEMSIPCDDYDRSLNHYIGRILTGGTMKKSLLKGVFCYFVTPILLLVFVLKPRLHRNVDKKKAIFVCPNPNFTFVSDDLPQCIVEQYGSVHVCADELRISTLKLRIDLIGVMVVVKCFLKKPFDYWSFSVLIHLSRIYNLIFKYDPSIIITTQTEEDYSSSLVTYYCEKHNVKYVCFQHGEYCYNPGMAFVRFSEYFAWNKETVNLLEMVNTRIDFATIYKSNRLIKQYLKKTKPMYFITYYLEDQSVDDIFQINEILKLFVEKGYMCNVRYHPRVKYQVDLESIFTDRNINIENPFEVSLGDSISNTEYVVAYKSTVLSEAIANSMNAVIDDLSGSIEYLEEICYANLKKTNLRLSHLLMRYVTC